MASSTGQNLQSQTGCLVVTASFPLSRSFWPHHRIALKEAKMNEENDAACLLALPDEVLASITSHLHDPGALLTLVLVCKRLQRAVEGAAWTFINVQATDVERDNLPRINLPVSGTEEWVGRDWGVISKYRQILKHRENLRFDQIAGGVERRDGDESKIYISPGKELSLGFGVSDRIMRSGVHKAMFELHHGGMVDLGIVRPMDYNNSALCQDAARAHPADNRVKQKYHRVWRDATKVNIFLGSFSNGQENETSDNGNRIGFGRVGFVLDMEKGTLSCRIKNHVCEFASGLDGEYVWVACIRDNNDSSFVRILEWE